MSTEWCKYSGGNGSMVAIKGTDSKFPPGFTSWVVFVHIGFTPRLKWLFDLCCGLAFTHQFGETRTPCRPSAANSESNWLAGLSHA